MIIWRIGRYFMKKKTIVIIVAVFAVLLLGAYMVFDNIFPKAETIKQLEVSMIKSVSLYDSDDNEIEVSDAELQKLLPYINAAEATRKMSVNDYPNVRPYYQLEVKTEERILRYMIYEEDGTTYVALPYEGIYIIDDNVLELFK